ncbi:class I adenylate-forming enzyme family protein [Streptomyces sp. W16]|uniref:class I adenylate-forming enzyme family protein n=1 Tax=Streptomyces sp. W16 TaxID=3076631 RepID=UPI00295B9CEC|nr:class I adenylate-forming enzyme family protein [Streptomyces sp. W16]MDV9168534.1 class I adenylate-forming enzyme family protein [Streptomyces sp. W16]
MSIFDDFRQVALRRPNAPALVTLDGEVSYANVLDLADLIAGGLLTAGLRTGDRVAVHLGNRPELVSVYYACLRVGAVIVPVSYKLSGSEVGHLLAHSGARFYLGESRVYEAWADVVGQSPALEQAWVLDSPDATATTRPWSDLLVNGAAVIDDIGPDEPAAIFYTSGTTGRPKSFVLSQATLGAGLVLMAATGAGHADATYCMVDLINPLGIVVLLTSLRRGRPLALTSTHTADVILRMLRTHRCGWICGAPSTFRGLLNEADRSTGPALDLRLTSCVAGGDACPPDLGRDFVKTFGTHLRGFYGLTETAAPVIQQPRIDAVDEPSIGWPLDGVEIRVEAEPGEVGELLLRSPSRPVGTWNGTELDRFDREQWISTGDMVRQQPDGCLLFVARQNDLIMVEGYPVSPLQIEQELAAHPDVAAAIVFGVPDAGTGERVIALVEPEPGRHVEVGELRRHLSGRVAKYKYPSEISLVEKLPVLSSGKLGRQRLAADYPSSYAG